MFDFHPVWAIAEFAARIIESGMLDLLAKAAAKYGGNNEPDIMAVNGDIAVIDISAPMVKRESIWTRYGLLTSTEAVGNALRVAQGDPKIRGAVLRMDTPGGTVDGQHKLIGAIEDFKKAKPIVTQVDGMAASAGYWAASKTNAIYSGPGDEVGSIGVRLMLYDYSRYFAAAGVEAIPIDTGEFKSAGAMGTKITDAQKEDFQRQVDNYFQDFYGDVRRGRKLSDAKAKAVADGRMFIAREAVDNGLIDGVQGLDETIRQLRRGAGRSTQAAKARSRFRDLTAQSS